MNDTNYFEKYLNAQFKNLEEKITDLKEGQETMRKELSADRSALSEFKGMVSKFPIKEMLEDIETLKQETDVPRFFFRHTSIGDKVFKWIIYIALMFATGTSIYSVAEDMKGKPRYEAVREPLEQTNIEVQ